MKGTLHNTVIFVATPIYKSNSLLLNRRVSVKTQENCLPWSTCQGGDSLFRTIFVVKVEISETSAATSSLIFCDMQFHHTAFEKRLTS